MATQGELLTEVAPFSSRGACSENQDILNGCAQIDKNKNPQNWGLFNPPKSGTNNKGGGGLASRDWAGEVGPHIPGRARRVGEARVCLQPLLRLRRDAAEDDVQSPEAHVDRLADRDARQASTEVAL